MGCTVSSLLLSRSQDFTSADLLLDQLEMQANIESTVNWVEASARYCVVALTAVVAMLMGSLVDPLDNPKKAPCVVDAACQTEEEDSQQPDCDWQMSEFDKCFSDGDDQSCTTEATDLYSDTENDEFKLIDEDAVELSRATFDEMCPSSCSGDCEIQADLLMRLTAIVYNQDNNNSPLYLEDFLCVCGECPQYQHVVCDVAAANTFWHNEQQRQSITRLLQAYSTYNEVVGYRPEMISVARECLHTWHGDEDRAFKLFTALYDEIDASCPILMVD